MRTTGGPGGGSITIAFVDRRIPTDNDESFGHPDPEGVTQVRVTDHLSAPDTDHGTLVAGIAAARRNGWGIHGVAYNANIVSIPKTLSLVGDDYLWSMDGILASVAGLTGSYGGGTTEENTTPTRRRAPMSRISAFSRIKSSTSAPSGG